MIGLVPICLPFAAIHVCPYLIKEIYILKTMKMFSMLNGRAQSYVVISIDIQGMFITYKQIHLGK